MTERVAPTLPSPQPMDVTIAGHLFGRLPFYDVVDANDSVVVDLHNRPDLVNIRGALQGGLVATLIDVAAGRLAVKYAPPHR
jgi:acyl-coenzyme A thioesterase PaaI-like protein